MTVLIDPLGNKVEAAEAIVDALVESGYVRAEKAPAEPAKTAKK